MEAYTVQIIEHVNYIAIVEAKSQEEAEQLAVEDVNSSIFTWIHTDDGSPCEVYTADGDYIETVNLKVD